MKIPRSPTIAAKQISRIYEDDQDVGLTEDERNHNGLDVDCARLVGVSCEICNVQTQSGVVTQHPVEICKMLRSEMFLN